MKVLGAAEAAGAWVELLLLLLPKRLGVGMEEDEVVELVVLVGLLAIKENAGFGPAAAESVALCPKVKEGFGASATDVMLLSAALPKGYGGGGWSVNALGLLKEKPLEGAGAGVASASLLAGPKRNEDGAGEAARSFFSSGFPKEKVGAAGSLSVCKDPNVAPPCGVVVAIVGFPSLPNTDPAVAVVVVVALLFAEVVSSDDAALSLFP